MGFPSSSTGKESTCNVGGWIAELGRCSGEGIGYPLQYSCASLVARMVKNLPTVWETWVGKIHGKHGNLLQYSWLENPVDRETWGARVHVVSESRTRLSIAQHMWLCSTLYTLILEMNSSTYWTLYFIYLNKGLWCLLTSIITLSIYIHYIYTFWHWYVLNIVLGAENIAVERQITHFYSLMDLIFQWKSGSVSFILIYTNKWKVQLSFMDVTHFQIL